MANNGAIVFWVSVLSLLCMVNNIICSISSKEARILNTKLGMFENKLFIALVDIDDIRSSVGTCQCPSQNSTITDASVAQLDTAKTNGIEEERVSKEVQSCVAKVTKGFRDEKQARKMFEKQMVNLIQDQIQSPIHGGWANWKPWGVCSHTCGIGLKRRHRECSNPFPSSGGNPCSGDYTDDKICMDQECPHVDGGWSRWTSWSQCTATCNGGLETRGRHCNKPKPSSHGSYCTGFNINSKLCNTKHCPEPIVFFNVNSPKSSLVDDIVVFNTSVSYSGNRYSSTTGKFTCKIPGLYHFSARFISKRVSGKTVNTFCYIRKNNESIVLAFNTASIDEQKSASESVYANLATGDTVYVGSCSGFDKVTYFSFHGALITAS